MGYLLYHQEVLITSSWLTKYAWPITHYLKRHFQKPISSKEVDGCCTCNMLHEKPGRLGNQGHRFVCIIMVNMSRWHYSFDALPPKPPLHFCREILFRPFSVRMVQTLRLISHSSVWDHAMRKGVHIRVEWVTDEQSTNPVRAISFF